MNYEWDPAKARTNARKHGIDFADATTVFSDDYAVTIEDEYPGEDRFVTIGLDALGRLLVVIFTWHGRRYVSSQHVRPRSLRECNTKANNERPV